MGFLSPFCTHHLGEYSCTIFEASNKQIHDDIFTECHVSYGISSIDPDIVAIILTRSRAPYGSPQNMQHGWSLTVSSFQIGNLVKKVHTLRILTPQSSGYILRFKPFHWRVLGDSFLVRKFSLEIILRRRARFRSGVNILGVQNPIQ